MLSCRVGLDFFIFIFFIITLVIWKIVKIIRIDSKFIIIIIKGDRRGVDRGRGARRRSLARPRAMGPRPRRGRRERTESVVTVVVFVMRPDARWTRRSRGMVMLD